MKLIFDFLFSFILLLILIIPLFIISFFVFIHLGWPIFFTQNRAGLNGKIFKMYKFRTMKNIYDSEGIILPDNLRITQFGKILRSSSLDELPELFNVLKGEMSLVGPRPLLVEYLPLYTPIQARRHDVKPGITGWAQINGRNSINWDQKFLLDIWYVDNRSFLLDLKILFITFYKVLKRENISYFEEVSSTKFLGSSEQNSKDNVHYE